MTKRKTLRFLCATMLLAVASPAQDQDAAIRGWLSWRGPLQTGQSMEKGLPEQVSLEKGWSYTVRGRGTPVVANGRVYAMGYEGEDKELEELIVCLDEATGKRIWEHRFKDFLTDVIYHRFAIGSPTVDPETGHVYCMSTAGLVSCFTADGELRWQHSMMSEYGRLSFPNGRTGAPLITDGMCIVHVANSGWGPQAPARDRFFAFNKGTGESIWSCTPGGPPKDASFSFPVVAEDGGRRVLYAGLAGGHVVCVDVRTGDPIWKFPLAIGGLSMSPVLYKDRIIATHGKENLDTSTIGRMVAIKRDAAGKKGATLGAESELWRNDLVSFTSSPVLVDNRIYQTVLTGDLYCVDADSGKKLWHKKLAPEQIHASPAWGDGKLYVPMNDGSFHIVRPSDEGADVLQSVQLEGNCLGAPAIANGRIYVHTTEKLYCFTGGTGTAGPATAAPAPPAVGKPVRLQVIPGDVCLVEGQTQQFRVRALDANGLEVPGAVKLVNWTVSPGGPSPAGGPADQGMIFGAPWAGVVTASAASLKGSARVRVVTDIPYVNDFDSVELKPHPKSGVPYAPAPSWWVGASKKWEVVELDGNKVLAKSIAIPLFQRNMSLFGHPSMSNYTAQVDIRTDGGRRMKSSAGLINQRYLIALKGNHQQLQVSSNDWIVKESVKFRWKAKTWYRMKTRVDADGDGSGWVRAKVWERDKPEPAEWTIEVDVPHVHANGSPGIWGFTPQSRYKVYLDNLSVTTNE